MSKFYIEDVTSLGRNINHVSKELTNIFNTYDVVEINGFGIVDSTNKESILKGMKLIIDTNAKIWSSNYKKNKKDSTRGRGRARVLSQEQEDELVKLVLSGKKRAEIVDIFKISESTLTRILNKRNIKRGKVQVA